MLLSSTVVTPQEMPGVLESVLLVVELVRIRCDTPLQYLAVVPSVLGNGEVLLGVGFLEQFRN